MTQSYAKNIVVRWGDLDALNHVNNANFLRYLEESRIEFLNRVDNQWAVRDEVPVVVNINCNFRRPIQHPCVVCVTLTPEQASPRRLIMHHTIVDADNERILFADAQITAVWINQKTGKSVNLPDELVHKI